MISMRACVLLALGALALPAGAAAAEARLAGCLALEARGELLAALEACRAARELAPGNAAAAYAAGRVLARLGSVASALDALEDAQRLAPREAEAYLLAALLLRDAGRPDEAAAVLGTALSRGVTAPAVSEQLALLLLGRGDRDRALELADTALERVPGHSGLLLARGLALAADPARRAEGVEALAQALVSGAAEPGRIHLELGAALLELGRGAEAVAHLREAVRLHPQMPEAAYRLGTALRAVGDREGAAAALARFQELSRSRDARDWDGKELGTRLNAIQELALEGSLSEALAQLDALLAGHGGETRLHVQRSKVLFSMGRGAEALAAAGRALELAPGNVEAHYLHGLFLASAGKGAEAEQSLRRALALDPARAEVHELLGTVLANAGRAREALSHWRRARELGADGEALSLNIEAAERRLAAEAGRP
jgi:tetratricopeptide (TPR) repeat protein